MTSDQILLAVILIVTMALLVWGRLRYDLVAFCSLLAVTVTGLVEAKQAFLGFGHPATVVIALVLIVSRGLTNAGVVEAMGHWVTRVGTTLVRHIFLMSAVAAGLSAIMNNVAALGLLMPVDLQAARRAKRTAALTLMPISFASILGGMITLIGTPPNIIIAAFREEVVGEPFRMFDFAPVGGACAVVGVLFVALIGWRWVPRREPVSKASEFELEAYLAEALVEDGVSIVGSKVRELDELATSHEVEIVGLVRGGRRQPGMARHAEVRAGDVLVLKGGPKDLDGFMRQVGLGHAVAEGAKTRYLTNEDVDVIEVVVPVGANVAGRSALEMRLKQRFGVHLLGVARGGRRFRERLRRLEIRPGDVLLLQGNSNELPEVVRWLGCVPLAPRALPHGASGQPWIATGIFAAAVILATTGLVYLPVALAGAVVALSLLRIVPLREVYTHVEWPVIVLIGSMIPIGNAMQTTGMTELIASQILELGAGSSPVLILTLLMVATMTLSDVMNNTATAVVVAPVAVDLAHRLNVSPDPFLMAVAVASSCAFLTPIGHKNNIVILGPGGYRFGDYWRMGLPLEVIIVLVGVPMILWVWPF